jgi:pyrroloquinoline quinone (PQQ) biosynthesis protein C
MENILTLAPGGRLSAAEAKTYVDGVARKVLERAEEKVTKGNFLRALHEGRLPIEALRLFWLNQHGLVVEINSLIQCAYQSHRRFFLHNLDLMAAFAGKIADELIHPEPPGHMLEVWRQGEIFGLTRDEMISYPMDPECRALLDWYRGLLWEGTMVEFWAGILLEEYIGHWAQSFRLGLEKAGYRREKAPYFTTHEEADLTEHEGVIAHGELNRLVVRRLLETGYGGDVHPNMGIEYCALTTVDFYAKFQDFAYDRTAGANGARAK